MNLYIFTLIAVIAILIFFIFKCRKSKMRVVRYIQQSMFIGILISIIFIVMLAVPTRDVGMFSYALYFACTDWLLFAMTRLVFVYSDDKIHMKYSGFYFPFLIADTIYLFTNYWHGLAIKIVPGSYFYGDLPSFEAGDLYILHGALIYTLVVLLLIFLVYKTITAAQIYKAKYYSIFFVVVGIVALNAFCVFSANTFDYSVYGYAIAAILIYHFAISYFPKSLINQTIARVAEEIDDDFIIWDEGRCIYANSSAFRNLRVNSLEEINDSWIIKKNIRVDDLKHQENLQTEEKIVRDGEKIYLKCQFNRIEDNKGRFLGFFAAINNLTKEHNEIERQRYIATHDALTGLYNRTYFYELANEKVKHSREPLMMMTSDVGRFKLINDLFGKEVGDEVLIRIANEIRAQSQRDFLYGRIGDDKFAVLMPRAKFSGLDSFNKMVANLKYADKLSTYPLKIYVGIYNVDDTNVSADVMCERAQMAISEIKDDYSENISYYTDDMRKQAILEQELLHELDSALENDEIKPYFQPIVDSEGNLKGAEALARWIHPVKGFISPGEFIPVFEKKGVIGKLDCHIWEKACQELKSWQEEGKDYFVSVNISPKDIYYLNIYKVITGLVEKYEVNPRHLRLEITESAVIGDVKMVVELIKAFQDYGFIVEMDDFGSGYSSLNMLKDLNVDVVKIDMKFLNKAKDEARSQTILRRIIELSRELNMDVITEGVEEAEQIYVLKEAGCELFQGFYFSKPVDVENFKERYFLN